MKKILLTIAFIVTAVVSAQAQFWIGGSVNAQINKETKTFTIAPDVGYCFSNTPFSLGCALEYEGSFLRGEEYEQALTISPYFRYDICDIEERFSLFVDLTTDIDVLEFSSFDIGLAPGVSFDLTEHWSAEFSYGFLGYQQEAGRSEDRFEKSFVLDFKLATASFGIYYNF